LLKPIVAAGAGALGAFITLHAVRAMAPGHQVVGLAVGAVVFALLYLGSLWAVGVEPEDAILARTLLGRRRAPR
jgi:hypothetical protein